MSAPSPACQPRLEHTAKHEFLLKRGEDECCQYHGDPIESDRMVLGELA
jgi:hypothetical protein